MPGEIGLTFGCPGCGVEMPSSRVRMADHGLVRCTCPDPETNA